MEEIERQILFREITNHLLGDDKPSEYIISLSEKKQYAIHPLSMLWRLKETEQSPKYHPEGSVWNHTMLVVDEAAKVRFQTGDSRAFMWAALLHDIGKPGTTRSRRGKITSYDHDKVGETLCIEFLEFFQEEDSFIRKVGALVRYHMHMLYVLKNLPYADLKGLFRSVSPEDLALLCRCDRLGRFGADISSEESDYMEFISRLKEAQKHQINHQYV